MNGLPVHLQQKHFDGVPLVPTGRTGGAPPLPPPGLTWLRYLEHRDSGGFASKT